MYKIYVISAGPGGKEYVTLRAIEVAKKCGVLIGTKGQLASVGSVQGQNVFEESSIETIMTLIEESEGLTTGVLVTGDAGIYSLCQRIIKRFGKEALQEVVPGVSSVQAAFAQIKEHWVNLQIFSYHGRPLEGLGDILKSERAFVLCDKANNSKTILKSLVELGLFSDAKMGVYVCQDLTLETQKVFEVSGPVDIESIETAKREAVVLIKENDESSST